MELRCEVRVGAPAHTAWTVLGERFGAIGEWAGPITASSLEGEPCLGAIRTCHVGRFGLVPPSIIKERLDAFDPVAMTLAYEPVEGMPSFVRRASNRWSVQAVGEHQCIVRSHAALELKRPLSAVSWLIKRWMEADGARVLADLRFQVEHGRPHPRKLR